MGTGGVVSIVTPFVDLMSELWPTPSMALILL